MMNIYPWLIVIHILSSTVLFGTGLGTAFQMWLTHRSGNVASIATVARNVVIADFLFTAPTVVLQPATGILLVWWDGIDPLSPWLVTVYFLYLVAGACWLPVVWLQIKIRDIAVDSAATGRPLPAPYLRYMRLWFILGCPAFTAVMVIFWLMVNKPNF
jgi:uncharacterized membrane protein